MESKKEKIKMSVCVMTYNHRKYIKQCLESLVNQNTNFLFEIIVGDDSSTDGTSEIVREFSKKYPEIIKPLIHNNNLGPKLNYLAIQALTKGEYISIVDGDDYALEGKLQAQADHLDKNPDCSVVWHRVKIMDQKNEKMYDDLIDTNIIKKSIFTQSDIMAIGSIACNSSKCFRSSSSPDIYPQSDFLDFLVDVEILSKGQGHFLNNFYGVYRSGIGITQNPRTRQILLENINYLCVKYPNQKCFLSVILLKMFISELKSKKTINYNILHNISKNIKLRTFYYFAKYYKYIKFFRSPI